jgi:hypothetical protein
MFHAMMPLSQRTQETSTAWADAPKLIEDWRRSRGLNQRERLASGREVAKPGQQSKVSLALLESTVRRGSARGLSDVLRPGPKGE